VREFEKSDLSCVKLQFKKLFNIALDVIITFIIKVTFTGITKEDTLGNAECKMIILPAVDEWILVHVELFYHD
jgi:hypothetical protein